MAGEATYVDDIRELQGTLHAALGLSPVAHGRLLAVDVARLRAEPGVVAVLAADDAPGLRFRPGHWLLVDARGRIAGVQADAPLPRQAVSVFARGAA